MNHNKSNLVIRIIRAFQKMDIWLLDDLLPDTIYQDFTKAKFLEKIEKAFISLRKEGDTSLEAFKGISHSEKDSWNRTGFSFVGNHSRKHIDFIFEGTSFDEVTNIYNCNDLELFDKTVRRKQQIPIDILHQERANYKRYKKYHTYDERFKSATDELLRYKETTIGVEIYAQWLEKYQQLYKTTHPTSTVGIFELVKKSLDKKGRILNSNSEETSS